MSHGSFRANHHGHGASAQIDLGHEPPLTVDGTESGAIDRRRVSVHWFSGTILTGLCGAALIGGAVFTSLDGEMTFAATPDKGDIALRGSVTGDQVGPVARKSDRLPPPSESNSARQVIRVSTAARSGKREIMRVRPFIRVAGNLSLTTSDLSAKVPPFNAQRLLADVGSASPVQAEDGADNAAEADAEVSFVTRDLAGVLPRAKIAATVPLEDVVMRVREASSWRGNEGVRYAVASAQPGIQLSYAPDGKVDLYAGFEARIVPENVTLLAKTSEQVTGGGGNNEHVIIVKKSDTITSILRAEGASPDAIKSIQTALGALGRDGAIKEGYKVRLLLSAIDASQKPQPVRVVIVNDTTVEAVAALSDLGRYVAVDVDSLNNATETADASDADENDDGSGVRLYQSIYETALRNKVPMPVVDDLIRVYSYDVDFQRKVAAGDSFEVFYAGEDENMAGDSRNEVLYASLTVGGETKKYYRFQTSDDGIVDYYDETGKSAKKFLVRKPVTNGIMRSGFGSRRHPILGYTKMHTGVDWAAPHGTPIFASGNGVVEKAGWEGGYGKYIRLKHPNGYETAYGHMTAFAKGMEPGKRVRQGQVIGYVGSTGLSTGAHVHYEILVNARFVDPMRIRLPRGRSLSGNMMAQFEQERERIDGMMTRNGARLAQNGNGQL